MYIYIYTLSLYLYIYYVILYYIPYIPSIHVCFAWKLWRQWKYHNSQYSFSNRIDRMEATWCVPFFTGFALPPARPLSACSCFLISVFLNTSYPVRLSTYSKSERILSALPWVLWSQSLTKDGKYHMKNTTLWCFVRPLCLRSRPHHESLHLGWGKSSHRRNCWNSPPQSHSFGWSSQTPLPDTGAIGYSHRLQP